MNTPTPEEAREALDKLVVYANNGWGSACPGEVDTLRRFIDAHSAPVQPEPVAWIPVAERMPTAGAKVLVLYANSYGRTRRTCAHYSPKHTVDASTWDEGEPDETEDGWFEPEGWWEEPVEIERVQFISDEVTHWMPLPAHPDASPPPAQPPAYTADDLSPAEGWTDERIADALDKAIRIMLPPIEAEQLQYRATIRVMRRAEKRLRAAQPAQAEFHNPWRTSLENCISGDNYLRASEYRDLIEELDELYRLRAAQPPREPVQPLSEDRLAADNFEWSSLYNAVSHMMARLGADGSIGTDAPTVEAVMDALHRLDAGQFVPGLTPRAHAAHARLTDAQIDAAWRGMGKHAAYRSDYRDFARAIERLITERMSTGEKS